MKTRHALLTFALIGASLVSRGDKEKNAPLLPATDRNPYVAILEDSLGVHMVPSTSTNNEPIANMRVFAFENAEHQEKCYAQMLLVDINGNNIFDKVDLPISMSFRSKKTPAGTDYAFDPCNFPGLKPGDPLQAVILEAHDVYNHAYSYALSQENVGDITAYIGNEASAARIQFGLNNKH